MPSKYPSTELSIPSPPFWFCQQELLMCRLIILTWYQRDGNRRLFLRGCTTHLSPSEDAWERQLRVKDLYLLTISGLQTLHGCPALLPWATDDTEFHSGEGLVKLKQTYGATKQRKIACRRTDTQWLMVSFNKLLHLQKFLLPPANAIKGWTANGLLHCQVSGIKTYWNTLSGYFISKP